MFITKSLNKWWISAYFLLPCTCCKLISLYLQWPAHTWTTTKKTPHQPQSVRSLAMLIAENATLPQLLDFWLQTRCKWDLRLWGGFYAASIGSFFADVSGQHSVMVRFLQRCWWIFKSSGTFHPVDWSIYFIFRANSSNEGTTFHRNVRDPSVDRA